VTISIDGVDYDTIKIPLDAIEQEPAVQRLKARGKELSFPRIDRLRPTLRGGLVKPNSRIEAAICATCWSLCVRAFLV
jgi:hypothetical protein